MLYVPPEHATEQFVRVADWLDEALSDPGRRRSSPKHVLDALVSGDMQLWVVSDGRDLHAAVVTELVRYPSGSSSLVVWLGGGVGMFGWAPMLAELEQAAKKLGCDAVEIQGRRGWGRVYRDYAEVHTTYRKEL